MNWEALGAIGEIVGAMAVVGTLLYVSQQLKEQSRALNTSVRDSSFRQLQEWNYHVIADPDLGELFQRAARTADWSEFTGAEQARLVHLLYSFFKVFENVYIHAAEGSMGEQVWAVNSGVFFAYANQPGCRRYWKHRTASFDPRFRQLLEAQAPSPMEPGFKFIDLD